MQVSAFTELLRQFQNFVSLLTRQGTFAAPAVLRPAPTAVIPPRRLSKDERTLILANQLFDQHFATKEDWFVQNW